MFLSDVWTLILTAPIHFRGSTGEQIKFLRVNTFLLNITFLSEIEKYPVMEISIFILHLNPIFRKKKSEF